MDDLELGLESETVNRSQGSQPTIRRNISLKLKQSVSHINDSQKLSAKRDKIPSKNSSSSRSKNDFDAGSSGGSHGNRSHSSLSSSWSTGSVQSMLKSKVLKVDNKLNLVGEKVIDPLIHTCEICLLPILIYGRLMPCKHILCFSCAKKTEKNCPRCNDNVSRIEQSALGTVFVCTVGGSKHGVSGCHRTYLSQRDLQSHIQHRHMNQRTNNQQQQRQLTATQEQMQQQQQHTVLINPNIMHPPPNVDYLGQLPPSSVQYVNPPPMFLTRQPQQRMMMTGAPPSGHVINMQAQVMMIQQQQQQQQQAQQQNPDLRMNIVSTTPQQQQNITMVMAPRSTNLITVPIQDERSIQQFQTELQHQAHFAAGAQYSSGLVQQQRQQQQHQAAQQAQQQQNQHQQLQASQTQYLMGQPQLINRPPMVNQGHLRPQSSAPGQLVGQQMVSAQMNIHAFQRFDDPNQHAQLFSAPQGMTTNAWLPNPRQPIGQQGPSSAGPNQQLQFY